MFMYVASVKLICCPVKSCVVRIKANCSHLGTGPMGEVPSVGVSLRDPSVYLHKFQRKPWKTQMARSTSVTRVLTWHLPSTSFKHRTAQPLLGLYSEESDIIYKKIYYNVNILLNTTRHTHNYY